MKKNKTSGELSIQYMDYKKLYDYFGWKPKGKFNSNLPKVYNWYKSYFRKNK